MSATYRYLNLGLIVLVLFTFAPNATAESPKVQLQGTVDRVIAVIRTIESPRDIEKNGNFLWQIVLTRFDDAAMAEEAVGNRGVDLNDKEAECIFVCSGF